MTSFMSVVRPASPRRLHSMIVAVGLVCGTCGLTSPAALAQTGQVMVEEAIPVEGLRLPKEIGPFEPERFDDYEASRPGAGQAVTWRAIFDSHEAVLTVGVYTRGMTTIPNDPDSKEIQSEVKTALDEITEIAAQGIYRNVKVRQSYTAIIDGGSVMTCAELAFESNEGKMSSLLCLGGVHNRFVKVRTTWPREFGRFLDTARTVASTIMKKASPL